MKPIDETALRTLFHDARSHYYWIDAPVDDSVLKELHDAMRWAPTSANCCPLRVTFVRTKASKEKLKPALAEGNVEKTMSAPVTAILGMDMKFYEHLPKLFPHDPTAIHWFKGNEEKIDFTVHLNAALQGGYFILAARALGLDCGPMSGFNNAAVDKAFFADTSVKSLFLCNLGHGDVTKLHPRSPRFEFEETCHIL